PACRWAGCRSGGYRVVTWSRIIFGMLVWFSYLHNVPATATDSRKSPTLGANGARSTYSVVGISDCGLMASSRAKDDSGGRSCWFPSANDWANLSEWLRLQKRRNPQSAICNYLPCHLLGRIKVNELPTLTAS